MSQNVPVNLTPAQESAALLVAQDASSDEQIAAEVGLKSRKTIQRWRQQPAFIARVAEHRESWRAEVKAKGIADVQNRVDAANDRHNRMRRIIEARAAAYAGQAPGSDEGLLVKTPMLVKVFEAAPPEDDEDDEDGPMKPLKESRIVYEWALDKALLAEMRAHEDEVAKHLGQLVDRTQSDEHIRYEIAGVDIDEV
jgi:hypothetical protein